METPPSTYFNRFHMIMDKHAPTKNDDRTAGLRSVQIFNAILHALRLASAAIPARSSFRLHK